MASVARATAFSIMVCALGACGTGGGGGGGGPGPTEMPPAPAPGQTPAPGQNPAPDQNAQRQTTPPDNTPRTNTRFTSFAEVKPSQNVAMSAEGRRIFATQKSDGTVQPITDISAESDSTLTLGFDSKRSLAAVTFSEPEISTAFDRSKGHTISCSGGTCSASSSTASAVIGDAFANGWNYQTYGVWTTHSPNPTTVVFGAVSAGIPTPGNAVPTTGLATFSGRASGYYIDPAGATFNTDATLTANVDFQQRVMAFNTGNTTLVNSGSGAKSANTGLNMTGTLNWDAGINHFSGNAQTANDTLSGNAAGKFYGPKAEEVGGTYSLVGGPTSRMVGGFGGKR